MINCIDTKALEQKIVEATSFMDGKEEGTQPDFILIEQLQSFRTGLNAQGY